MTKKVRLVTSVPRRVRLLVAIPQSPRRAGHTGCQWSLASSPLLHNGINKEYIMLLLFALKCHVFNVQKHLCAHITWSSNKIANQSVELIHRRKMNRLNNVVKNNTTDKLSSSLIAAEMMLLLRLLYLLCMKRRPSVLNYCLLKAAGRCETIRHRSVIAELCRNIFLYVSTLKSEAVFRKH